MAYERRLHPRKNVNWQGQASWIDGPSTEVRVLDVSAGGACLEMPATFKPRCQELLELSATSGGVWPLLKPRPVNALARIVRVNPIEGHNRRFVVGVRFHTPLRCSGVLQGILRFPRQGYLRVGLAPSA